MSMPIRAVLLAATLFTAHSLRAQNAQGPPNPSAPTTFRVTTRLVFLDVTVLDKRGRPVVKGLTKDDFTITESKREQRIVSFEAPEAHVGANSDEANAPATVLVLDLLNSRFEDFAYIRFQVRKYLLAQPSRLNSSTELMVLGNRSLELVQTYTRNKVDLLSARQHVPAALPFKLTNGAFYAERFAQSIDALQQIALQNRAIPGRKNIVWVGHGGPSLLTEPLVGSIVDELHAYVHDTTNMLVDARMSLFVIYPGLRVSGGGFSWNAGAAEVKIGDDDPFAGDINFGVFVNETGGNLFYNRNDIADEIKRSQELGSQYYTLIYEPAAGPANGKFRRVRVGLRDPGLRALTKAGYFAPDHNAPMGRQRQRMIAIAEAIRSTLPFQAVGLTIENLVRYGDSGRVEFTVAVKSGNIVWQAADDGKSTTSLTLAAASIDKSGDVLASKLESVTVTADSQDAQRLAETATKVPVRLRVPPSTKNVRVVVQTAQGGALGSVELNAAALAAAPEAPASPPDLILRAPASKP